MEQLRNQLRWSKKQTAYAWAKYYEEVSSSHDNNVTLYNNHQAIMEGAEELPSHIVGEIEKMCKELKKDIECPICLDVIGHGKLKITGCGHKFCEECFNNIDTCAICRKKINKK